MLTEQEYVDKSGLFCPYCESDQIEPMESVQVDGTVGLQGIMCADCKKTWTDIFRLTGYSTD